MGFLRKIGKLAGIIIAATTPFMFNAPAYAITQSGLQNSLVNGGSIWLETTIAVAMVFVTAMAFSLQIARGYFLRTLEKFTLRLGADIWWLAYVLIRDALIFMSFIMGLLVFFPGTFQDYTIAVPFMPISVVLFGIALVTKLYFDADDNRNAFRAVTVLVFAGTALWIFGTIFVTETPLALSTLPAGVSSTGGFWYSVYNTFSSQTDVNLSMATFDVTFAALGVIGLFGFAHPLLHSRLGKQSPKATRSQGPGSPSGMPASMPSRQAHAVEEQPRRPIGSMQAPASFPRDGADYIQ
ncbi:MAG: hypothetical protein JRN55_03130 [Nitrososphaerota archaeon]|jgi:hypothetical protein|nr:hypothetical protein [Nitrososphaerota archaeon]